MIEKEEKIIFYLEEIDNTFSSINRTLRKVKDKIEAISKINNKVVLDYTPWISFFKHECNDNVSVSEKRGESFHSESPILMKTSSPKNPFMENTSSSSLLNRNLFDITSDQKKESSGLANIHVIDQLASNEDSDSSCIREFDVEIIPSIFKKERDLENIYNFIKSNKKTSYEQIVAKFSDIENEKLNIFLELLKNKKFIKKSSSLYYID